MTRAYNMFHGMDTDRTEPQATLMFGANGRCEWVSDERAFFTFHPGHLFTLTLEEIARSMNSRVFVPLDVRKYVVTLASTAGGDVALTGRGEHMVYLWAAGPDSVPVRLEAVRDASPGESFFFWYAKQLADAGASAGAIADRAQELRFHLETVEES